MQRVTIGSSVSLMLGLFVFTMAGCSHHKEEGTKVAVADVPGSVITAMNARLPGAEIRSVEREKEGGNVVYDLELSKGGRKYEMDIKEDGTVLEIEKEVAVADLPQAVTHAVRAKYPNATIKEVMEVNIVKGGQERADHYEVVMMDAGKEREVNVSLDGTSIKQE